MEHASSKCGFVDLVYVDLHWKCRSCGFDMDDDFEKRLKLESPKEYEKLMRRKNDSFRERH